MNSSENPLTVIYAEFQAIWQIKFTSNDKMIKIGLSFEVNPSWKQEMDEKDCGKRNQKIENKTIEKKNKKKKKEK